MATSYTSLLGFAQPVTGTEANTWGTVVNDSVTALVEDAIAGSATEGVTAGDWTLTTTGSGAENQARSAILIPTGTPGVSRNIIAPSSSKAYIVDNQSDGAVVLKGVATTGATIATGTTALVAWNGTDFVLVSQALANVTGVLPVAKGGTGITSFGTGVATALGQNVTGSGGMALSTSPTLTTPNLGTPSVATLTNATGLPIVAGTTGTLAVNRGGTGASTLTGYVKGSGTAALSASTTIPSTDITGLGTIATQNANAVDITGGSVNGTAVGASTASTGAFTTLSASGTSTLAAVNSGALAVTGAVTSTTDATLSGVRVGKGAGAIASNTAVGSGALNANTTGINNTANGVSALRDNTTGSSNTAIGLNALVSNTTGNYNTASGLNALQNNTTGNSNTASGANALRDNTTGSYNTAVGEAAMLEATSGNDNVAVGRVALRYNTASSNVAVGTYSLGTNTTGSSNTATGHAALISNTTGNYNTASGVSALYFNTTGISNTASGVNALNNNTTGSGNTAVNPRSSAGGYNPVFNPTTENNRFCMGSTGVTNAYIQVAWTVVSDARDKTNFAPVPHGLEFVKALQPTAYQFRTARDSEETNGGVRYGFKAQDVLALEGDNPVIVDNEDEDKLRMVDTALIPVLVKAVKELSAKVDELQTEINTLKGN